MFIWARFPHIDDSLALAEAAQRDGIMLAPGAMTLENSEVLEGGAVWLRYKLE